MKEILCGLASGLFIYILFHLDDPIIIKTCAIMGLIVSVMLMIDLWMKEEK